MSANASTRARALRRPTQLAAVVLAVVTALGLTSLGLVVAPGSAAPGPDPKLHLVVLDGPGTAGIPPRTRTTAQDLRDEQDETLAAIGDPSPVYRWTTALNGYAVRLDRQQAARLAEHPAVAHVEANAVREMAGTRPSAAALRGAHPAGNERGGAGTVVGVVDSGIWADSPLFASVPGLGRAPRDFNGICQPGEGWTEDTCDPKLVGARWFVEGFGRDRVRSTASLSAHDDAGHGTQVASIAAGNAGVSVAIAGESLGPFSGVAPQARVAVYKACWTAPSPSNDGCATADLVTAIDRATADGVDVLTLSVAGGSPLDAVDRALLGAAEADIVVAAAAGNDGRDRYAGHAAPWVTSVGAVTSRTRLGEVRLADGTVLQGAMSSRRRVAEARVVLASDAVAPGADPADARTCVPGALDGARTAGAVVVCERGRIGRVDKSDAVRRADGVAMVLVNRSGGRVADDIHAVPTVHLPAAAGRQLVRRLRSDGGTRASIEPTGVRPGGRVLGFSPAGNPQGGTVKPDLVAPGSGVLGAVPPSTSTLDHRWEHLTGTSAAAAGVAGEAARVRSRHPEWSAAAVRSALATSTAAATGDPSPLRQGSGRVRGDAALRPGLVFDVPDGAYRRYLSGARGRSRLNTPAVMLGNGTRTATREVTNVGRRAMYYSLTTRGLSGTGVSVQPAAIRIGPGETRELTVRLDGSGTRTGGGRLLLRGANGVRVAVPVVVTR